MDEGEEGLVGRGARRRVTSKTHCTALRPAYLGLSY